MRRRALALSVVVSLLAAAPAVAAEEYLQPYTTSVSREDAQYIADQVGDRARPRRLRRQARRRRICSSRSFPSQAAELEAKGIELQAETLPKLGAEGRPRHRRRQPQPVLRRLPQLLRAGRHRRRAAPSSPREHRDVVKLVEIGKSLLGKPILAIKITANARNIADGSRPAVLLGATNHAREWITPEVVRREAHWILDHQDDPRVQKLLKKTEVCGSCPSSTRTATTTRSPAARARPCAMCGPGAANSNRLWRKTLRDNNNNGIYGNAGDGVDPNRNFPEQWALDKEGSSATPSRRGLPRPVRELRARERRLRPAAAAASSRSTTSTTTRPRSCSTARSASSPTARPTTTRSRAR